MYFKTENSSLTRKALVEMTVKATGASATSVKKIAAEEDGNKSPCKNRPKRTKHSTGCDEFDLGVKPITYSLNSSHIRQTHHIFDV